MTLVAPTSDTEIESVCQRFRDIGQDIVAKGGLRNELVGRCYEAVMPAFIGWLMAEVRTASAKPEFQTESFRLQLYNELTVATAQSVSFVLANLVGAIQPNVDLSRAEVHALVMRTVTPMIERSERQADACNAERVTYLHGETVPFDFRTMMGAGDGRR